MTMRRVALALVLVGLPACAGPPPELVLVVDTDMPLPQRYADTVVIDALVGGTRRLEPIVYDPHFGLPATLALLAPADPNAEVKIEVTGIKDWNTNPIWRTRTIHLHRADFSADHIASATATLNFLCAGSGTAKLESPSKDVVPVGSCAEDKLECIGGWCDEAPPSGRYTGNNDAGCFDTVGCFDGASALLLDRVEDPSDLSCAFKVPPSMVGDNLNVGLVTKNDMDGTCGPNGCYIPLNDADLDIDGDTIRLPCEVCARLDPKNASEDCYTSGKAKRPSFKPEPPEMRPASLLGVKIADCTPKKTAELPLCNLHSKSGPGAPTPFSITLARRQAHPVSIAVSQGVVDWVNSGTYTLDVHNGDSTVMSSDSPNDLIATAGSGHSFRDIAMVGTSVLWTDDDISANPGKGRVWCAPSGSKGKFWVNGTGQPVAIAGMASTLFWTQTDGIHRATVTSDCDVTEDPKLFFPISNAPPLSDIAASSDSACWTGTDSVQCAGPGLSELGTLLGKLKLKNPKGIAIQFDASGKPTFGALVDFDAAKVFGVDLSDPTNQFLPIPTVGNPVGVAIDEHYVYWTEWETGTVNRVSRVGRKSKNGLPETGVVELLAKDQDHPSAIVVDDHAIYWVNEGKQDQPTGSIAARSK